MKITTLIPSAWEKLARLPFFWRAGVKEALLLFVLLGVFYPHVGLLVRQVKHLYNPESLIQPDLPAMAEINREIDATLHMPTTRQNEFHAVQSYVYKKISYAYDWDVWGNVDYWPTAAEVWERKREDCDGQAVLAASILRARGFKSARLAGNINHIWVAVDKDELMSPEPEKNFTFDGGRLAISLPSAKTSMGAFAMIGQFPVGRTLALIFALLLIFYHPCRSAAGFFGVLAMALTGFVLLLDWAHRSTSFSRSSSSTAELAIGAAFLAAAFAFASLMHRISEWQRRRTQAKSFASLPAEERPPRKGRAD